MKRSDLKRTIQKRDKALAVFLYLIAAIGLFISPFIGCQSKNKEIAPHPTAVIAGGSMVPALLGKHHSLVCNDCKFPFPVDSTNPPDSGYAVCPNCGYDKVVYDVAKPKQSETIPIQTGNKNIQRWDLAAFRFGQTKKKGVKRVVGLPGETILIKNGDVWVNGKLAQRPWRLRKQMMISHYDSRYVPTSINISSRWNLENNQNWTFKDRQFIWRGSDDSESESTGLNYQPVHCFASKNNRKPLNYVPDIYGFNQNLNRIELNVVDQIFVKFPMKLDAHCYLTFSTSCGGNDIVFKVDPTSEQVSIHADSKSTTATLPTSTKISNQLDVGFCTFDSRPTLLIGGKPICELDLTETAETVDGSAKKSRLEFDIRIHEHPSLESFDSSSTARMGTLGPIQINRDLYYFSDHASKFTLADDEFLLLGDNVPISIDSRNWDEPAIPRKQILGTLELESPKKMNNPQLP